MMRHYTPCLLLLCLLFCGRLQGQTPATSPAAPWSLSDLPVQEQVEMTTAQLRHTWNAFARVAPRSSGFSAVVMPFHVAPQQRAQLEPLANALAFLLSFDLDWAPDCYCARHAYFVFKRDRQLMLRLQQQYAPSLIADAIAGWKASHAIGGEISGDSADHLTGVLRVYDRRGNVLCEHHYDNPRPFHQLLGDMSCDALKAVGAKPSDKLLTRLHLPRCSNNTSLTLLGRVAFAPERGETEFGAYRQILQQDPGFTEVRYWLSNQSYWQNNDRAAYQREKLLALRSHLMRAAFADLDLETMTPEEQKEASQWCQQIEEAIGLSAPVALRYRLRLATQEQTMTPELLETALATAAAYPNDFQLAVNIGQALFGTTPDLPFDGDLSVSLYLSVMESQAMPGAGDEHFAAGTAILLKSLGYPEQALALLEKREDGLQQPNGQWVAVASLFEMGQFQQAKTLSSLLKPQDQPLPGTLFLGAAAAALSGDTQYCSEVSSRYQSEFERLQLAPLLKAFEQLASGKAVPLGSLPPRNQYVGDEYALEYRLLCELILALCQNQRCPDEAELLRLSAPTCMDRLYNAVLAEYCARYHLKQAAGMATMWAWLRPSDPLTDHLRSIARDEQPSLTSQRLARLLARFQPEKYPHGDGKTLILPDDPFMQEAPPWMVAAVLKQLLEQGNDALAKDLALRYRQAAACYFPTVSRLRGFANHLVYEVARLTPAKPAAAAP